MGNGRRAGMRFQPGAKVWVRASSPFNPDRVVEAVVVDADGANRVILVKGMKRIVPATSLMTRTVEEEPVESGG